MRQKDKASPVKRVSIYNQGDALLELKETKEKLCKLDGFELAAHFAKDNQSIKKFDNYKHFLIWAAILIKNGKTVKKQTDEFIFELTQLNNSFFIRQSKVENVLNKIIGHQKSVRNYENDIYDFINSYSASDINQKANEITALSDIMEEVNRSFDRAYNLASMKIQNISNLRISILGLAFSIIAIFVALITVYLSVNEKPKVIIVPQGKVHKI